MSLDGHRIEASQLALGCLWSSHLPTSTSWEAIECYLLSTEEIPEVSLYQYMFFDLLLTLVMRGKSGGHTMTYNLWPGWVIVSSFNTRTGGLFCNRSRASLALKGPSKVSERRSDSHSAFPLAVDMAWLSPPKVELTALGNL